MSVVSNRYAEALFDISVEQNNLNLVNESMLFIVNEFNKNPQILEVLTHPEISREEKINFTREVFSHLNKVVLNFLCVLVESSRTKYLFEIYSDFEVLHNRFYDIIVATVYTVIELREDQIIKLEFKLGKSLNHKIRVSNIVDPTIIGGMKIIIENHVIDGSIQAKLIDLKYDLNSIQIK